MNKITVTSPLLPDLDDFNQMLREIWDSKWITNNGSFHQRLEQALCDYLKVPYISLFTNGTLPLITALQALNISGEVITTPYSFVATTHSIWWNGIKPVFVDIDPTTGGIDPDRIEAAITPRTTAIMPVHVYGKPCRTAEIQAIADKYGLRVIYDAAHAFGIEVDGKSILNSDLMAWNKYFRKPGNEPKVRQFYAEAKATRGGQPLGISEYGDAGSIKIHTDPRYDRIRDHAENYQLLTHEGYWRAIKDEQWLWCKCIWQFSDMQTSIRHEGDRDGMNDKGVVTYDRQTCKDIYYFYKAQWNPEPMVYITGRRFKNRKHGLTDVKAYTNQKEATLFVNGCKIGKAKADDIGRLQWKDVQLSKGDNVIEVRSGKLSDTCTWTLKN